MKSILPFCAALIFSISVGFSQSDYREGYIINLSNDTIQGFINNKGNLKSLTKCRFKSSLQGSSVDYSPEEINAFRIYDRGYYVSMEVDIDGKKENYFLEKLIEGIVDIYYYSVINEGFYLLQTEDGEIYELKNTRVNVTIDDGSYTRHKKEYVSMLRYLFSDSPDVVRKVDQLSFESNAMIDIAQTYHNDVCDDYACIVYAKKKSGMKLKPGLYAGYSVSSFSLESQYFKSMNRAYSKSHDFLVGLFLNISHPDISERFSIQLGLNLQDGKYVYDTSYYSLSYLKVPFSIKYSYPVKKIKPSLQVGMAYNKWLRHEAINVIRKEVKGDAIQDRTYQYGFLIGLDFSYELSKRLSLFTQFRYEKYRGKLLNYYSRESLIVSENVKSKSDFISFSLGLKF